MQEAEPTLDEELQQVQTKKHVSAIEALREVMLFHRNEAEDIILKIIMILRDMPKARGDLLAGMYKEYAKHEERLIDCASKLAPFESPKLQALEVKNEVTHRFVMRSPNVAKNTEAWMQDVGASRAVEFKLPPTQHVTPIIDNIEEIEEHDDISNFEDDDKFDNKF